MSSTAGAPVLELDGVSKAYGAVLATRALHLTASPGELMTVIGPSGCGKSTLLRLVAGLERPTTGTIAIAGDLVAYGLELERFGPASMLVRATPAPLGRFDVASLVRDLAAEIAELGGAHALKARLDLIAATFACHHSVRAGRILSVAEMNALLREMEVTPHSGHCNHGRPTWVKLAHGDIERLFGRR